MKTIFLLLIAFIASTNISFSTLYVDGEFNGWDGETVVKLSDGTYWIQSELNLQLCLSINPKVDLYKEYGRIKMLVNGCGNKGVAVEQLTDVIESRIDGEFKGFEGETVFQLKNGSVWKQKRYKYWYKYAYNPECIVYYYNGWKLSIFDKTIDVEKISGGGGYSNNKKSSNYNNSYSATYLKVQNNTDKLLYFCYSSYNGSNGWQSNGWYKVDAYSYTSIDIGSYTGNIYLYAEYNAGESAWFDSNSKYSFCIDKSNAFNIPNADTRDCSNSNYKRVKMSEFSVTPGVFTWTLNP